MTKKIICILMAVALCTGIFAACGTEKEAGTKASSVTPEKHDVEKELNDSMKAHEAEHKLIDKVDENKWLLEAEDAFVLAYAWEESDPLEKVIKMEDIINIEMIEDGENILVNFVNKTVPIAKFHTDKAGYDEIMKWYEEHK